MNIIDIKNIIRKDMPIYYRRFYTGVAVMNLVNKSTEVPMEFMIEHMPTGNVEIRVTLPESLDYPLLPLQKELKKFIGALDSDGKLPD